MDDFFKKQTASSRIKANIVAEYFPQYCRIIMKKPQQQIRYLDLFSGPGLYEDESFSTPLLIARACANDPSLAQLVHLIFNDNKYSEQLKFNFQKHIGVSSFKFEPKFGNKTVGECESINSYLKKIKNPNPYPTVLFFDPWGYKGIDTSILAKFMENWGNEIFLFVNIKRIHAAIENEKFDELMKSLFPKTFESLRHNRRYTSSVYERLSLIMDNLANEFKSAIKGNIYFSAFKFQEEDSNATSHFIVHITKHPKGYELVKQVYYDFDNIGAVLDKDGNYTFDAKLMDKPDCLSLEFTDQNVELLSKELLKLYKNCTISARALFDEHHPKTKYCGSHYLKTLRFMESQKMVTATYSDGSKHRFNVVLIESCELKFN